MKKMMGNYSGKLQQLLCLLICVLMVVAVSIRRDGKVAGRYVNQQQTFSPKTEPMAVLEDGSVQLNTTELGKDIVGYGGIVPLEITLQDGRVSEHLPIQRLPISLLRLLPFLLNGMARR